MMDHGEGSIPLFQRPTMTDDELARLVRRRGVYRVERVVEGGDHDVGMAGQKPLGRADGQIEQHLEESDPLAQVKVAVFQSANDRVQVGFGMGAGVARLVCWFRHRKNPCQIAVLNAAGRVEAPGSTYLARSAGLVARTRSARRWLALAICPELGAGPVPVRDEPPAGVSIGEKTEQVIRLGQLFLDGHGAPTFTRALGFPSRHGGRRRSGADYVPFHTTELGRWRQFVGDRNAEWKAIRSRPPVNLPQVSWDRLVPFFAAFWPDRVIWPSDIPVPDSKGVLALRGQAAALRDHVSDLKDGAA